MTVSLNTSLCTRGTPVMQVTPGGAGDPARVDPALSRTP